MRRILAFERVTPEGYFAAADGDEQRLFVLDPDLDRDVMRGPGTVDTFLWGRKTFEHMAAYWPGALDDPNLSEAVRKMAVQLNEQTKIVFSRTVKSAEWKNTRFLSKFDPEEIASMKEQSGGDMMVLGSGSIVSQLTEHGLMDEYLLVVSPMLLGRGSSLFSNVSGPTSLKLTSAKGYKSGNVLLRYTTVRDPQRSKPRAQ
jgi:dihydrofolate reductase